MSVPALSVSFAICCEHSDRYYSNQNCWNYFRSAEVFDWKLKLIGNSRTENSLKYSDSLVLLTDLKIDFHFPWNRLYSCTCTHGFAPEFKSRLERNQEREEPHLKSSSFCIEDGQWEFYDWELFYRVQTRQVQCQAIRAVKRTEVEMDAGASRMFYVCCLSTGRSR